MKSKSFYEEIELAINQTAKCPSCSHDMVYHSEENNLVCESCGQIVEFSDNKQIEEEYTIKPIDPNTNINWDIESKIVKCYTCHTKTIIGENKPLKLEQNVLGDMPNAAIPFSISYEQALIKLKAWCRHKYLAPECFRKCIVEKSFQSVYMPCWIYQFDAFSSYSIDIGIKRIRRSDDRQEITYKYDNKTGVRHKVFNDYLVYAGHPLLEKCIQSIALFNTKDTISYHPSLLQDSYICPYIIDPQVGFNEAKKNSVPEIEEDIMGSLSGDRFMNLKVSTVYKNIQYLRVLVPVYLFSYNSKNKVFRYIINGQTGEAKGQYPISVFKLIMLTMILFVIFLIALIF